MNMFSLDNIYCFETAWGHPLFLNWLWQTTFHIFERTHKSLSSYSALWPTKPSSNANLLLKWGLILSFEIWVVHSHKQFWEEEFLWMKERTKNDRKVVHEYRLMHMKLLKIWHFSPMIMPFSHSLICIGFGS